MLELCDFYDENSNHLGVEYRDIIHEKGLWHKTVRIVVIRIEDKKILRIKRTENKPYPNKYDFLGGHLEFGETYIDAYNRELNEELERSTDENTFSIRIGGPRQSPVDDNNIYQWKGKDYLDNEFYQLFFFIIDKQGEVTPKETIDNKGINLDYEWKTLDEIKKDLISNQQNYAKGIKETLENTIVLETLKKILSSANQLFQNIDYLKIISKITINPLHNRNFMNYCFMTNRECVEKKKMIRTLSQKEKPSIFVVMRLDDNNLNEDFEQFREKIKDYFSVNRSDKFRNIGYAMCGNICRPIQESEFVIVVITDKRNQNVLYELGLSLALNKRILLINPKRNMNSNDEKLFPKLLKEPIELNIQNICFPFNDFKKEDDDNNYKLSDNNDNFISIIHNSKNNDDITKICDNIVELISNSNNINQNFIEIDPEHIKLLDISNPNDDVKVLETIRKSSIVIIHISLKDYKCYFWLGIAHGLQKYVICLFNEKPEELPFDIKVLHLYVYEQSMNKTKYFKNIGLIVQELYQKTYNPVHRLWLPIIERSDLRIAIGDQDLARKNRVGVGNWDIYSIIKMIFYLTKKSSVFDFKILDPISHDVLFKESYLKNEWRGSDVIFLGTPESNKATQVLLHNINKKKDIKRVIIKARKSISSSLKNIEEFSNDTTAIHEKCEFSAICNNKSSSNRKLHGIYIKNGENEQIFATCSWIDTSSSKSVNAYDYLGLGHVLIMDNPYCSELGCFCNKKEKKHKIILIEGITGPVTQKITEFLCGEYHNENLNDLLIDIGNATNNDKNNGYLEFLIQVWVKKYKKKLRSRDSRIPQNIYKYTILNRKSEGRSTIIDGGDIRHIKHISVVYKGKVLNEENEQSNEDIIDSFLEIIKN
ncbi:MAG: NUDIX domain-containing protein [Promethearchaeota archaeon]